MAMKLPNLKPFAGVIYLSAAVFQFGCVEKDSNKVKSGDSAVQIKAQKNADSTDKKTGVVEIASDSSPKNIIVFIGDGMGISTLTAGRIFVGQDKGQMGEDYELSWDKFQELALIKTYNTNAQVPDSAGTATAILSGYKTNRGAINVRPDKNISNMILEGCGGPAPLTLSDKAKRRGKAVGVVTTARLTHATPAAMYAHSASRNVETQEDLIPPFNLSSCKPIAQQLIESDVDLAFGGGLPLFTETQLKSWPGKVVTNKSDMMSAPRSERLLAVFDGNKEAVFNKDEYDLQMNFESKRDAATEPSIKEMTTLAIERLSSEPNGYVLMVESGRIDHAHHGANAFNALNDLKALDEAVQAAVEAVGDDTLIIVTADHSHVFTMAGYPTRGNPILGLVREIDYKTGLPKASLDNNKKPYTTLGYHNGPNVRRADSPILTDNLVQAPDYKQQSAVELRGETHAGEDVALFAKGPGASRFKGVMEQDEIGQILEEFLIP